MYLYAINVGKKTKSPAILASAADHKNDILISSVAIIGFLGPKLGFIFLEPVAAMLIGLWILKVGFDIGSSNLKFLMGAAPNEELLKKIRKIASEVKGVENVHDVRAHYVGTLLHVEVHIRVDRNLTVYRAHTIGKKVKKGIERLGAVDEAFIHIDPVIKSREH